MIINITLKSNESNQKTVFNVSIDEVFTPSDALNLVLKTVRKLTNYKVEAELGLSKYGGGVFSLIELIAIISEFKFYKYKNKKVTVEIKTKLASFCAKPFSCEYAEYIGATFFDDINRRMIKYTRDALKDILPWYCPLYKSKAGNYYCWKHLSMEHTDDGWTLYEITKKEIIKQVEIVEK